MATKTQHEQGIKPSKNQLRALEALVENGSLGEIKVWFESYSPDTESLSPAMNLAAHNGHTAIAAYLARRGARTDRPELIECACSSGDPITVVVLLEHGAPDHAINWAEQPALVRNAHRSWKNSIDFSQSGDSA